MISMSSLQFFLVSLLMFFYFSRVVSTVRLDQTGDDLEKEINKTKEETKKVIQDTLVIQSKIDKLKSDIKSEESSFEDKRVKLKEEENKLALIIYNLTEKYAELNQSIIWDKEEIAKLTNYKYRLEFAIVLYKTDLEFYEGLNTTHVQETCFEFLRNKTRHRLLSNLAVYAVLPKPSEDPKIIYLESLLRIAKQNLTDAKMVASDRIKVFYKLDSYLFQFKYFTDRFVKNNNNTIKFLENIETYLKERVKHMEYEEKLLQIEIKTLSGTIDDDWKELRRIQNILKTYQDAIACYSEIEYEFKPLPGN